MVLSVEEYLKKIGVQDNDVFDTKEAEQIMNDNVISFYKNRIRVTEEKEYTGYEIATKLHNIHSKFEDLFKKTWNEEFPEDPI